MTCILKRKKKKKPHRKVFKRLFTTGTYTRKIKKQIVRSQGFLFGCLYSLFPNTDSRKQKEALILKRVTFLKESEGD